MKDYTPAIDMFLKQHLSTGKIAEEFGVSRQTISHFLRKQGIDCKDHVKNSQIKLRCENCGKSFTRSRCYISKKMKTFCDPSCYRAYQKSPEFQERRVQVIRAREVLERVVGFSYDWHIDFIDGNVNNLDPNNLIAFKSQVDRTRWHRGGLVMALLGKTASWKEVGKELK